MEMKLTFYAANREEWRAWLESHHESEREVWLIYYRANSGVTSIPYDDSVEEALCFGWIDSIVQRIDEHCYGRKFNPRQANSPWSPSNMRRVAKLAAAGRITPAGLAKIPFEIPAVVEEGPLPRHDPPPFTEELLVELQSHAAAWAFFQNLPPSHQRRYTGWIMDAKKDETRRKRLAEAIYLMEQGKALGLK
jgi:uncharacterized protein YdeI (YjbR/CyaY-like superfamily)